MIRKISVLPLLFLGVSAFAQVDDAAKYAGIIRSSEMQKHLTIIAADDMEGRETGTAGQRKAAVYIENFFKTIGLQPPAGLNGSYQQLYPLYKDSLVSSKFKINGKEAVFGTDYLSPANNNETGKFSAKSIVFAGYGIDDPQYSDYTNLNVKGKTVAFVLGEPKKEGKYFLGNNPNRSSDWSFPGLMKKINLALSKGAKGVLVINANSETFNPRAVDASKKTNVYYPREAAGSGKVNYAQLSHAYAKTILGDKISAAIAKAKNNEIFEAADRFETKTKTDFAYKKQRQIIYASNVLGVIEGTDKKDEYVFVTAHYDHVGIINGVIYNGADDDGSGTVAIMQMAEAFAKAKAEGKGPHRTVIIMAVSGEEKGLWGSEYYTDHPLYPLDKTTVDLNIDMIGRIDTERMKDDTLNYVYVVGHDKISSDLPIINEAINNKYTGLVLDYKFDDPADPNRIYFRSDHYNFARKGVPVLFFYDGMLKADYHKPGDDIEKIYWALYEKRARMVFHTAWEMANRNDMLKRDIPLSNQTR